ncbi:MAG: BTAD domain-containing putative transcriptional regulator [Gordonia sp. (in: high G+C Gram-positive bacteria)]
MTVYRVLGSVVAESDDGLALSLGGPKQRRLLAVLLDADGRPVPTDRVIDALWGDSPPAKAPVSLRAYASNLRHILGAGTRLESRAYGCRLVLDEHDTYDAARFAGLVTAGRAMLATGRADDAAATLTEALTLWHGPPFVEFPDLTAVRPSVERYEALRHDAVEARFDALLQSGQSTALIGELEAAVLEHPLAERLWGHLMLALHRAGRTGEALRAYDRVREVLDAELGTGPGDGLRRVFRHVNRPGSETSPPGRGASPATPASRAPSPFFGRNAEQAVLFGAASEAVHGRGELVVVSGVSGIGKTRLVRQLTDSPPPRLHPVWAFGTGQAGAPALWTWIQVLREIGELAGPEVRAQLAARHESVVTALVPEWLPISATPVPAASGEMLADGLLSMLRTVAAERPLLVVLDDLHAADDDSLQLVRALAPQLHRFPILLIGTWSLYGADRPVAPERLAELRAGDTVTLTGLDRTETGALVGSLGGDTTPAGLKRLRSHTGGNPFFLREMVRATASGAVPGGADDVDPLVSDAAIDVVAARLHLLDDTVRHLLVLAAVLGRRFDLTALADVAELPVTATNRLLRSAYDAGLLDGVAGTPGSLAFAHGIVRDAVLGSASSFDRRRAHADAARRRRHTGSPIAYEAILARADHAWRAGAELDAALAVELHQRALDAALARSAYADVVVTAQHALEIWTRLPADPNAVDRQTTTWLHLAGASAILHGHGSTQVSDAVAHAVELGRHATGRNRFGAVAAHCQLLCGLGRIDEARAIVDAIDDDVHSPSAEGSLDAGLALRFGRVMVEGLAGDYRNALRAGAELLEQYPAPETVTDPLHFFHPRVHCFMAIAHAHLGERDAADESCRTALELARSRGDLFNILTAQLTAVEVDGILGARPGTAGDAAAAGRALTAAGATQWAACAHMVQAWAHCLDSGEDTAIAAEDAYAAYVFDGTSAMTPYFLSLRADIELRSGRPDAAQHLLRRAEAVAQSTGEHAWNAMIDTRLQAAPVAAAP